MGFYQVRKGQMNYNNILTAFCWIEDMWLDKKFNHNNSAIFNRLKGFSLFIGLEFGKYEKGELPEPLIFKAWKYWNIHIAPHHENDLILMIDSNPSVKQLEDYMKKNKCGILTYEDFYWSNGGRINSINKTPLKPNRNYFIVHKKR